MSRPVDRTGASLFPAAFLELPCDLRHCGRSLLQADQSRGERGGTHHVVRQGERERDGLDFLPPASQQAIPAAVARQRMDSFGRRRTILVERLGFLASHAFPPLSHRRAVRGFGLVDVRFGVPGFRHRCVDVRDLLMRRPAQFVTGRSMR